MTCPIKQTYHRLSTAKQAKYKIFKYKTFNIWQKRLSKYTNNNITITTINTVSQLKNMQSLQVLIQVQLPNTSSQFEFVF